MNSNDFYKKFNNNIENVSLEELKDIIRNVIRKIPETKYEEILNIFNKENNIVNEKEIIENIKKFKEYFKKIDNFELYFEATGYEEYGEYYDPWGGDWVWEYTDNNNIGSLIYDATIYAVELTNKKQYKHAKELFDTILHTNYQVLAENGGDDFEISLTELKEHNLINVNVNTLCLYAIYVTYQSNNKTTRVKYIYNYFKNENFKNISIEDSFKLGSEILKDTDIFWNNWINYLLDIDGNIEYRLIKEALEITNYNNYKEYVDKMLIKHPKLYIDLFNYLVTKNKVNEIIEIGNLVLNKLDKNLIIRNDIALYLAEFDDKNKEKYILESFKSNTNIPNLFRLINNNYYINNKDLIKSMISINEDKKYYIKSNKNIITKDDYYYLNFFIGNFEEVFEYCKNIKTTLGWSDSYIKYCVYLWLSYFNKFNNSKVYNHIINNTFDKLEFKNNTMFLDEEYVLIFDKWKKQFNINDKEKYIEWLKNIIDIRVNTIVSGSFRSSYYKAAILVVALGEVLESNNIMSKDEFVDLYHKKYPRRTAFRSELRKYM